MVDVSIRYGSVMWARVSVTCWETGMWCGRGARGAYILGPGC
jgi:hypothetical protein